MNALPDLLRAELLKLRTSRTTWLLLGAMTLTTLAVVALVLSSHDASDVEGARGVRKVLTIGGGVSCFFALSLGVVGMAGEYRHATIGQALLGAPARWPIVVAKLLAQGGAGLLFGLVALAATFAVGLPGLAGKDAGVSSSASLVRYVALGTVVAPAAFAMIGVGLAALARNQALALSIGLGWMALVDTAATGLAPAVGKFLPAGTVDGLLRSRTDDVLPTGLAALILFTYALALAAAGALALRRRDLT